MIQGRETIPGGSNGIEFAYKAIERIQEKDTELEDNSCIESSLSSLDSLSGEDESS